MAYIRKLDVNSSFNLPEMYSFVSFDTITNMLLFQIHPFSLLLYKSCKQQLLFPKQKYAVDY